jgi:hypothetical protein
MTHRPSAIALALAACCALPAHAAEQDASVPAYRSAENAERAYERRAVETVLWAMPIVSVEAMREAYFRDAGARYNDFVYWPHGSDALNQTTTPNSTSHYVYANVNVKDGPVVFVIPPTGILSVYGNLHSAWQQPVEDFGPGGIDKGQGGTFLLTPPGWEGAVPAGMQRIAMPTLNGYFLIRPTPRSADPREAAAANAWIGKLRLYPLSAQAAPPRQRFIDMTGKLFDAITPMDDRFFDALARILPEEAADRRDMTQRGQLISLGMGPDQTFAPTADQRKILARAAAQAHSELTDMVMRRQAYWWPGSKWGTSWGLQQLGKEGFIYERNNALLLDDRARTFYFAFALPRYLGKASFYLTQTVSQDGTPLDGDKTYVLHVPAKVPARDFWAINTYDLETSGFLRGAASVGTDSNRRDLVINKDGSVDITFSATMPKGGTGNWVTLVPGRRWTAMFRLYGPAPALFDKGWRLPDIEAKP